MRFRSGRIVGNTEITIKATVWAGVYQCVISVLPVIHPLIRRRLMSLFLDGPLLGGPVVRPLPGDRKSSGELHVDFESLAGLKPVQGLGLAFNFADAHAARSI
jgi:hypothetical protein